MATASLGHAARRRTTGTFFYPVLALPRLDYAMLKDGTYAAWFKTPLREGAGIVHFANGKIWGGDSIISYSGSYEIDSDRWTATVTTKRHSAGHSSAWLRRAGPRPLGHLRQAGRAPRVFGRLDG